MQIKSNNNMILDLSKVGIIYNSNITDAQKEAQNIEVLFKEKGVNCVKIPLNPMEKMKQYDNSLTFAVVVGGDGTLLGAARYYAKYDVPVFGINVGRLGFLAQLQPKDIKEGIDKIVEGRFKIEERIMLKAAECDENSEFQFSALNDIVIKGGTLSRSARLYLYINDKFVCDYIADGLIISTPTGSTAYTLSAGGPIVAPGLEAIVIVPICPHSLTTRPLVIPANEQIKITLCEDCDKIYLTADGQENFILKQTDSVSICKNEKSAKLILLEKENNGFYSVLREKLHWGKAPQG